MNIWDISYTTANWNLGGFCGSSTYLSTPPGLLIPTMTAVAVLHVAPVLQHVEAVEQPRLGKRTCRTHAFFVKLRCHVCIHVCIKRARVQKNINVPGEHRLFRSLWIQHWIKYMSM